MRIRTNEEYEKVLDVIDKSNKPLKERVRLRMAADKAYSDTLRREHTKQCEAKIRRMYKEYFLNLIRVIFSF